MSQQEINNSGAALGGGIGDGGDWPKASIGNYKGVMLCNRPNEFGQQRRPERTGLEPFNSRVDPKLPIGWNPATKLLPRSTKKKRDPNSILVRHRKFLKQLELQKNAEREEQMDIASAQQLKKHQFKDQAAKQRDKIRGLKTVEMDKANVEDEQLQEPDFDDIPIEIVSNKKSQALTAANLDAHAAASKKAPSTNASRKGRKAQKPAWAVTEKMQEDEKEAEIDELLEFAYELDYEKYMDDYEVRQALAIIKDRVNEVTKAEDWKENMAHEWNQATAEEDLDAHKERPRMADNVSRASYKSGASNASKMSFSQRVAQQKKNDDENKPNWDASSTCEKKKVSAEDRVAAKIANEVLRDNAKLRAVHSGPSIKKLLEREAKKQMALNQDGGGYTGPLISTIVEKDKRDKNDPSNLPYLHKNPAV